MKHTFAFIFGIVLLVAFIWLATTLTLQYNKSKENDEKLNVQSYCYQQNINYVMLKFYYHKILINSGEFVC